VRSFLIQGSSSGNGTSMPITEGKPRASRIPLDDSKHRDPLVRWQRMHLPHPISRGD